MSLPPEVALPPREYSEQERSTLLQIAHTAIERALNGEPGYFDPPSAHLAEPRGVFTTLYIRRQLRGCVGYFAPVKPLYITVAETACASAFTDSRFPRITPEEAAHLCISLSVLSPLRSVRPEEIQVGVHGLVVSQEGHRGLLLPQVAVEQHWDRETFLAQTCRKAQLPTDAWKHGATLEAFTAEVFADSEPSCSNS